MRAWLGEEEEGTTGWLTLLLGKLPNGANLLNDQLHTLVVQVKENTDNFSEGSSGQGLTFFVYGHPYQIKR